jgi:hypothetical protein
MPPKNSSLLTQRQNYDNSGRGRALKPNTPRTCCITGATGCYASFINGTYQCTTEIYNGYPVFIRDDVSTNSGLLAEVCIEHTGGIWQVKNALSRRTSTCFARIVHDGPLEAAAHLDTWMVSDGDNSSLPRFVAQPAVRLNFSGGKVVAPARAAAMPAGVPPSPATSQSSVPQAAPLQEATKFLFENEGTDGTTGQEPFHSVLCRFFEAFDIGGCGLLDVLLLAPALQALHLEDHIHIICGELQLCGQRLPSRALCFISYCRAGALVATISHKNSLNAFVRLAAGFAPAFAASSRSSTACPPTSSLIFSVALPPQTATLRPTRKRGWST